jgi:hypothetical protein
MSPSGAPATGRRGVSWRYAAASTVALVALELLALPGSAQASSTASSAFGQYIVADSSSEGPAAATSDVQSVGGTLGTALPAANAVVATLTSAEVAQLQAIPRVTVTLNFAVSMSGTTTTLSGAAPAAVFPQQSGATQLWSQGDFGSGVNVAVVDWD